VPRKEKQLIIPPRDTLIEEQSYNGHRYAGHAHFWERAMMSRRQFMRTAAGATGVVLASGLWMPGLALADNPAPKPIPGGFKAFGKFFHVDPSSPGPGAENSTIFDFHGSLGAAVVRGTGTGTHTGPNTTSSLLFDVDMRFMQGVYIGIDGKTRTGTFSFI
jgi:hypothetical protein